MVFCCGLLGFWKRRLYAPINSYEQTPPLARYRKYHEQHGNEKGVGFFAALCITINLIMGSGFLALPKAFVSCGILLGMVVVILCALLLRMTAMYEVEVMCRAEAWVKANMVPVVEKRIKARPEKDMHLSNHAYQVTEMCEIFGGSAFQRLYTLGLFLYMAGALWGYGAVFGAALSAYAPIPGLAEAEAYQLYIFLFAAVVVPLSVLDIKEQAGFQMFLTFLRFLILIAMVGSIMYALLTDGSPFGEEANAMVGTTPLVRWSGIGTAIPTVMFALVLASTTPTVVQSLEDKTVVGPVVWAGMSLSAITYLMIAGATAYYFGSNVAASCNVNWDVFSVHHQQLDASSKAVMGSTGGMGAGAEAGLGYLLKTVVAYFVVLFPAIDVTSVYPLNVMVVANNIMAAVYSDRMDKAEKDRVIVTTFRMACAIPPLVFAAVFRDLTKIVDYAGALAVVVALVFPAYLNYISQIKCRERFGVINTPYTGRFSSSPRTLWTVLVAGAVLFITLIVGDIVDAIGSAMRP